MREPTQTVGLPTCNATEVDLRPLRRCLKDLRVAAGFSVADLERCTGVAKSTIYRIEDVKKDAAYEPDLSSVVLWVACCGWSLSDFFHRVEKGLPITVEVVQDSRLPTLIAPAEAEHGGPSGGERVFSRPDDPALNELESLILDISAALASALARLKARRPPPSAGPAGTDGDDGPD